MEEVKPADSDEPLESTESSPGNSRSSILAWFRGLRKSIVVPEKQPQPMEQVKPGNSDEPSKPTESSPGNACSSILARFLPSIFASEKQPQPYEEAPKGKILEILRIRNRFDKAMNKDAPHWSGGFRDLAFKVKVGFKVPPDDAASSRVPRTVVSALQRFACRNLRVERRSLCQCISSCLHASGSWLQSVAACCAYLTPIVLQKPLGRPLRQDLRLRAADSPPST
jgi:hypothetical protein